MEVTKVQMTTLRSSMKNVFIQRLIDSRKTRKMIVGQWLDMFSDEDLLKIIIENMRQDKKVTIAALKADGKCTTGLIRVLEELL